MKSISTEVYSSIRSYWRRRTYKRLEGSTPNKKAIRVAKFGGGKDRGKGQTRRFWKLRPQRKLRVRFFSPIKLLARLRETYISTMLALAGIRRAPAVLKGPDAVWEKRIPRARQVVSSRPADFDQRIVLEIYKSLYGTQEITGRFLNLEHK